MWNKWYNTGVDAIATSRYEPSSLFIVKSIGEPVSYICHAFKSAGNLIPIGIMNKLFHGFAY
jgi:hypothetical protein